MEAWAAALKERAAIATNAAEIIERAGVIRLLLILPRSIIKMPLKPLSLFF
jgi:hypothetical protein